MNLRDLIMTTFKQVLLLTVCLFPYFAVARLGDAPDQLSKRLGVEGEQTTPSLENARLADTKVYNYRKNGLLIRVDFWKGKSCEEIYKKEDGSELSESEIQGLLKSNNFGQEWKSDESMEKWNAIERVKLKRWTWGDTGKMNRYVQHIPILEATYGIGVFSMRSTKYAQLKYSDAPQYRESQ